jgi:hypothetical protein
MVNMLLQCSCRLERDGSMAANKHTSTNQPSDIDAAYLYGILLLL